MSPGTFRLVVQPDASAEVAEAVQWYEVRERGLGREFLRAFKAGTAMLRRNPFLHQVVEGQARRLLLRRVPYGVFYEIHGSDVVILACLYHARDPRIWQDRITRD